MESGTTVTGSELGVGHALEEIPEEVSNQSAGSSMEDPTNSKARYGALQSGGASMQSDDSTNQREALPRARAIHSGRQVLSRGQVGVIWLVLVLVCP